MRLLAGFRIICEMKAPLIDQMQRRSGPASCEVCGRETATRRAKFSAQYLQATSSALFEEESLVGVQLEKRVCEACLRKLQEAKNVTDLIFERL
jgi:hypothetical protein